LAVAFANARDLRVWLLRLRTAVYLIHGQMEDWLRFGGTERYNMSSLMELRMMDEFGMVVSNSITQVRSTRREQ
jgi:hypothetical protein